MPESNRPFIGDHTRDLHLLFAASTDVGSTEFDDDQLVLPRDEAQDRTMAHLYRSALRLVTSTAALMSIIWYRPAAS